MESEIKEEWFYILKDCNGRIFFPWVQWKWNARSYETNLRQLYKTVFFQIGPFSKFSMKFIIKYEYINITYPAYLTFFVIF